MKILMVSDYLTDSVEGGADRILYEHATRLEKSGHFPKIIAPKDRNPIARLLRMAFGSGKFLDKSNRVIDFDVINFHQPLSAFFILSSGKVKDIFKIYTFHSPWYREYEIENDPGRAPEKCHCEEGAGRPTKQSIRLRLLRPFGARNDERIIEQLFRSLFYRINSTLRKKIERFCLDKCDKIIVLSEYMKRKLMRLHSIEESKIRVVPGGVDTEKFRPAPSKREARERISLPGDKCIMLSVRRLVKRMGLVELITASRGLLGKRDDLILVIAGDGPRRKEIENMIRKMNLGSKIILRGFVSEELLPVYYQASDLFVMPTQKLEGFGLAALEALSSGVPVLGTPVGGIPEVLSGLDPMCLSGSISTQSLREGVEGLLSDRKKMSSIAGKARPYAIERFSWEKIIPKLEKEFTR